MPIKKESEKRNEARKGGLDVDSVDTNSDL